MLEGTLKWKEMTRTDRRQGCPPEHWVVLGITAPCQAMGAAGGWWWLTSSKAFGCA